MKILKGKIAIKRHNRKVLTFVFAALFVWWGTQVPAPVLAQTSIGNPTPVPNCSLTPTPSPEQIVALATCSPCITPPDYQPPYVLIPNLYQDPDQAKLAWIVATPTPAPTGSPPGILLIHGASWYTGDASDMAMSPRTSRKQDIMSSPLTMNWLVAA